MRAVVSGTMLLFVLGCTGSGGPGAPEAEALVVQAFDAQVNAGPYGTEVLGRGVWYDADALNSGCLQTKEWAFRGKAKGGASPRISPVYAAQDVFQAATEHGFCVYVGDDLTLKTHGATFYDDVWTVDAEFAPTRPGGWWDCVDDRQKRRGIRVLADDETGELGLDTESPFMTGGCPSPMTLVNLGRRSTKRPKTAPRSAPSGGDVVAAAKRFDDALFAQDWAEAYASLSCWNLYESDKYGSCSAAELVNVGPIPRGDLRKQDGPPWSVYAFDDFQGWGEPERDRTDKTMYHVQVAAKTKKVDRRTISVQWVEGEWKLVGIVQRRAEGLTSVAALTDLGRSERREIFERRVKGEPIDIHGVRYDDNTPK